MYHRTSFQFYCICYHKSAMARKNLNYKSHLTAGVVWRVGNVLASAISRQSNANWQRHDRAQGKEKNAKKFSLHNVHNEAFNLIFVKELFGIVKLQLTALRVSLPSWFWLNFRSILLSRCFCKIKLKHRFVKANWIKVVSFFLQQARHETIEQGESNDNKLLRKYH